MAFVTILHTNDFHNHLSETQAHRLKDIRKDLGDRGLLLDSGDAISSGNITYKPGGEPVLDLMSDAGYDAMTVGNREFHFSAAGFCAKVSRARFPVLCANVHARGEGARLPVVPLITRTLSGRVRVTVFGLTVPMITERMLARKVSSYVFDDPVATAVALVPTLRSECDLLICLSHIGLAKDRELATRVPGIDLIIGGHTHAVLETGERVGETLIVQAGWWGHYLGTVTVEVDLRPPAMVARIEPL
jgi:2',3'-cyclic-nucleotide 2'-phosphodiesterase (5'-nucleotidase family)